MNMYHLRLVHGFFFMLWTAELFLPQTVTSNFNLIFVFKLTPVMMIASVAIIIDVILKGYKNPEGTFFFWITFWLTIGVQVICLYHIGKAIFEWFDCLLWSARYHPLLF
jgi:hypothetical protein